MHKASILFDPTLRGFTVTLNGRAVGLYPTRDAAEAGLRGHLERLEMEDDDGVEPSPPPTET